MDKIKLICVVKDIFFYKNSLRFKLYRSRRPGVFCKKMLLEISQNSQGNTCTRFSLLIKTLAQAFSCKFWEIFKNNVLEKLLEDCFCLWSVISNAFWTLIRIIAVKNHYENILKFYCLKTVNQKSFE